jgi:MarR family 2-MHQ and catechol resistance regulon transcriptional repressor
MAEAQNSAGVADAVTSTYRILLHKTEELLSEEGVTLAQLQVLRCVATGPLQMKGIGEKMLVTGPDITGLVDRLERRGYVKRIRNGRDRRAMVIELTPEGRFLQRKVSSKYRDFVHNALQVLTVDEQEELQRALLKLQDGMSASRGRTPRMAVLPSESGSTELRR